MDLSFGMCATDSQCCRYSIAETHCELDRMEMAYASVNYHTPRDLRIRFIVTVFLVIVLPILRRRRR